MSQLKRSRRDSGEAPPDEGDVDWCFERDSVMSELTRNFDWGATELGALTSWPVSSKTSLSIAMGSRFPMIMFYGTELRMVYNDAYMPLVGKKHPSLLGGVCRESFSEVWDKIGPMLEGVLYQGKATWMHDSLLMLERNGYPEETYWTYSYSPIRSSAKRVDGVFTAVEETTARVLSERRLRTLSDLSAHASSSSSSARACQAVAGTLSGNIHDLPFSVIYRTADGQLRLERSTGVPPGLAGVSPETVSTTGSAAGTAVESALRRAHKTCSSVEIDLDPSLVPSLPPWNDSPSRAIALPLVANSATAEGASSGANEAGSHTECIGVLLVGLNTRKALDVDYSTFLRLLAAQVSSLLLAARAYERERQRAEALAELDRAKTAFFNNISHEFRTPLTLILGPLEELIDERATALPPGPVRDGLSLVHRSALRLLKLVNVLLDFSRIEAGRGQATYRAVDLPALTADLASVFRAACEKEGLRLIVNCSSPLSQPAFVDVDMWEKIVLNLLSNAYKYTLAGEIEASLTESETRDAALLTVRDTGCGIPAGAMPRLFERFHRIESSRGRTHEGTGIGLALVWELVRLHHGTIRAASQEGLGTTFFVSIPLGRLHLPEDRVVVAAEAPERSRGYARSVEWWVPSSSGSVHLQAGSGAPVVTEPPVIDAQILVADDNADMLAYVTRILASHGYNVVPARHGEEALRLAREARTPPDLVLSDIMMPRLHGRGLLDALRADARLKDVPVIFLSARAGEEARSEGIAAGADDYLVKPFSARELVVRVGARLEMARVRRAAAARESALREEAERANLAKDQFLAVLSHELRGPLTPALMLAEEAEGDNTLPLRVRESMRLIQRSVELVVRFVNDLLDVTKIRQHKLSVVLQPADAHHLLSQSAEMLRFHAEQKKQTLEVQLRATRHTVSADPARLQQVFWNLLGNAIKFTPRGGHLLVRSVNSADCDRLMIEFRDDGIGMEPERLARLFQPFEQGDPEVHRKYGGLGLGLSISRTLAERHGGELTARSDGPDRGSVFTLTLPVITPPSPAASRVGAAAVEPPKSWRPLRVLLVEDNEVTSAILKRMLEARLGHAAATAATLSEARLQVARPDACFDVVMCDVGLPDGSGLDLVPLVKSLQARPYMIVLTGYGSEEDVARSYAAGCDLHMTKPIGLAALREALDTQSSRLA